MNSDLVDSVRAAVARIPAGNVSTYGEVGKVAGCGPRYVGRVLREHGADLPWWRVVNARGETHDASRSITLWEAEGISFARTDSKGARVCMSEHAIDARELAALEHDVSRGDKFAG